MGGVITSAQAAEDQKGHVYLAKQSVDMLYPMPYTHMVSLVEQAARTCYQSKLSEDFEDKCSFIRSLIKHGHESVLEHVNVTMELLVDRGILAEWTRHRVGSAYSVESTRYVSYSKHDIPILIPYGIHEGTPLFSKIMDAATQAIYAYQDAIDNGALPEQARALLPQCLGVHMVVTHNLRQWRHVFRERLVNKHAHPDIRRVMALCFMNFVSYAPVFVEDIAGELDPFDLVDVLEVTNPQEQIAAMFHILPKEGSMGK